MEMNLSSGEGSCSLPAGQWSNLPGDSHFILGFDAYPWTNLEQLNVCAGNIPSFGGPSLEIGAELANDTNLSTAWTPPYDTAPYATLYQPNVQATCR
jgi:hypothetical protein